jgi:hypothetical protein
MLDEQERRALREIELGLSRHDPEFASRMRDGEDRRFPTVLALSVSLYIVLPMVTLLFGWVAAVIVLDIFAVLVMVALFRRRGDRPRR